MHCQNACVGETTKILAWELAAVLEHHHQHGQHSHGSRQFLNPWGPNSHPFQGSGSRSQHFILYQLVFWTLISKYVLFMQATEQQTQFWKSVTGSSPESVYWSCLSNGSEAWNGSSSPPTTQMWNKRHLAKSPRKCLCRRQLWLKFQSPSPPRLLATWMIT